MRRPNRPYGQAAPEPKGYTRCPLPLSLCGPPSEAEQLWPITSWPFVEQLAQQFTSLTQEDSWETQVCRCNHFGKEHNEAVITRCRLLLKDLNATDQRFSFLSLYSCCAFHSFHFSPGQRRSPAYHFFILFACNMYCRCSINKEMQVISKIPC